MNSRTTIFTTKTTTMKKIFHFLIGAFFIAGIYSMNTPSYTNSVRTFQDTVKPAKNYCVSLPIEGWQSWSNILEYVKNKVKLSDMPSREAVFITDSLLTPLQMEISRQITPQMAKDTLRKK